MAVCQQNWQNAAAKERERDAEISREGWKDAEGACVTERVRRRMKDGDKNTNEGGKEKERCRKRELKGIRHLSE